MDVNWFPGHMTKALRNIKESIQLVDLLIETCDARIPKSSRNPELAKIAPHKPRLVVYNKADLADVEETKKWLESKEENVAALSMNALHKEGLPLLLKACKTLCQEKIERAENRGRMNRPIRAMLIGIPNTGKSTLINAMSGKKAAHTSDRPGVTRAPQWIRTEQLELMDMPGVLWPKLGTQEAMLHLAATGAVKDDVIDIEEIAFLLLQRLCFLYPQKICERFSLEKEVLSWDSYLLFQHLAKKRGCILSGGRLDLRRFSILFVDEFRAGKIGKMTLEPLQEKGE